MQILRGCGIGAESCGRVLSDILEAVTGKRAKKGGTISKHTVKKTDHYSGKMSAGRFLKAVRKQVGTLRK